MCVSKPYMLSWIRTWCVCGGQRPIACSYSLQNCGIFQWLERVCPNCDNSRFFNVSRYICTDVGQIPEMEGPIHLETFQQVNSIGLSSTFSNKNSFRLITSQPGANFNEQIDDTSFKHNKIQDSRQSSTPIWTQIWRLLVYNCVYPSISVFV